MRILFLAAGVAGLALTAPAAAWFDDQGRGKGQAERGGGGGGGGEARRGGGGDKRAQRGAERARGQADRARGRADRVRQRAERRADGFGQGRERMERQVQRTERRAQRTERRAQRVEQREERGADRAQQRQQRFVQSSEGREQRQFERREQRAERRTERRSARVENVRDIARLDWDPDRSIGRGCPPGLAKKNNGCLPPGQAQQIARQQSWYNTWWSYPDSSRYVYDDGYLLGVGNNDIESYIPLLGGALWSGNAWPEQYEAEPVSDYYQDYYGLQESYDYRYADGAIYGVDPQTQLIQQVAALIAGDEWVVGQQMPEGYDIYNVPYEYRDQYQDTDDASYRYSDGYVYQVDPTTQLIQAAIQLIT